MFLYFINFFVITINNKFIPSLISWYTEDARGFCWNHVAGLGVIFKYKKLCRGVQKEEAVSVLTEMKLFPVVLEQFSITFYPQGKTSRLNCKRDAKMWLSVFLLSSNLWYASIISASLPVCPITMLWLQLSLHWSIIHNKEP